MSDTGLIRQAREGRVRPSDGQERLWFLEQLSPGTPVYHVVRAVRIKQLAAILGDPRGTDTWSSLIPVQPAGTLVPFFWIHGDSSNARLPEYLGPDRPMYALEHQGHDGRPALHTEVETITSHYLKEVRRIRPHGPYLLGGYSLGAAVAYEMAHQLTREREEVSLLFLLDPPSIEKETSRPALDGLLQLLRGLAGREELAGLLARVKNAVRDRIAARTASVKRNFKKLRWKAHLRKGRILPPSLRSAYILDVYRRGFPSYAPNRYPGRVVIFKSDELSYRAPWDWPRLMTGEVDIHEVAGGHMDMMQERYVAMWAPRLREALDGSGHSRKTDRSAVLVAALTGDSDVQAAVSLFWMAVDCVPLA